MANIEIRRTSNLTEENADMVQEDIKTDCVSSDLPQSSSLLSCNPNVAINIGHRDSDASDGSNHLMVYEDDAQARKSSISFDKIKQISLTYSLQSEDDVPPSTTVYAAPRHQEQDEPTKGRYDSEMISPERDNDLSHKIKAIDSSAIKNQGNNQQLSQEQLNRRIDLGQEQFKVTSSSKAMREILPNYPQTNPFAYQQNQDDGDDDDDDLLGFSNSDHTARLAMANDGNESFTVQDRNQYNSNYITYMAAKENQVLDGSKRRVSAVASTLGAGLESLNYVTSPVRGQRHLPPGAKGSIYMATAMNRPLDCRTRTKVRAASATMTTNVIGSSMRPLGNNGSVADQTMSPDRSSSSASVGLKLKQHQDTISLVVFNETDANIIIGNDHDPGPSDSCWDGYGQSGHVETDDSAIDQQGGINYLSDDSVDGEVVRLHQHHDHDLQSHQRQRRDTGQVRDENNGVILSQMMNEHPIEQAPVLRGVVADQRNPMGSYNDRTSTNERLGLLYNNNHYQTDLNSNHRDKVNHRTLRTNGQPFVQGLANISKLQQKKLSNQAPNVHVREHNQARYDHYDQLPGRPNNATSDNFDVLIGYSGERNSGLKQRHNPRSAQGDDFSCSLARNNTAIDESLLRDYLVTRNPFNLEPGLNHNSDNLYSGMNKTQTRSKPLPRHQYNDAIARGSKMNQPVYQASPRPSATRDIQNSRRFFSQEQINSADLFEFDADNEYANPIYATPKHMQRILPDDTPLVPRHDDRRRIDIVISSPQRYVKQNRERSSINKEGFWPASSPLHSNLARDNMYIDDINQCSRKNPSNRSIGRRSAEPRQNKAAQIDFEHSSASSIGSPIGWSNHNEYYAPREHRAFAEQSHRRTTRPKEIDSEYRINGQNHNGKKQVITNAPFNVTFHQPGQRRKSEVIAGDGLAVDRVNILEQSGRQKTNGEKDKTYSDQRDNYEFKPGPTKNAELSADCESNTSVIDCRQAEADVSGLGQQPASKQPDSSNVCPTK